MSPRDGGCDRRGIAPRVAASLAALVALAVAARIVVANDQPTAPSSEVAVEASATPEPSPPPRLPPLEAIRLSGVEARGAALLITGQSGGDVDGATLWTATTDVVENGTIRVPFVVEIDGRALLDGSPSGRIPVELYGYLVDDDGTVVDHLSDGILLDHRRHGETVRRIGLKFVGEFRLEPGLYSFRVLLRNRLNRRYFLHREDLAVPEPDSDEPFLLPPLVAAPDAPWLVASHHGLDVDAVEDRLPGLDGWPTGRPGWPAQQPLDVVLGTTALGDGWSVTSRLITAAGREVDEPEVVIGKEITSSDRLVFHRATVDAPDLPPGEYRLELRLVDAESGRSVTRSLPVIVHDGDSPLVWTDPAAPRRPPRRAPPSAGQEMTKEALRKRSVRAAYLAALRQLADGNHPEARRALARLERRASALSTARSWTLLRATEWETVVRLARSRPDALMATILFHRDMYRWYRARYESELAEHSWRLAEALVGASRKLAGLQAPEGFAEGVLLDLASDLVEAGQARPAQRLMELAVAVTPSHPQALLGLGTLHERADEPDLAVRYLQELVDAHPNHHEARLRLAVNLERQGRRRAAERLFEDLLAQSVPGWIQTLAYQELAGLMIRSEYLDEAEQLLRLAIGHQPRNQRLRILLAYVLDQAGRPREATTVIERLEAAASQHSTSPRYRYGAWPDLDPERIREVLDHGQRLGLEALQEVLR